MSKAKMINESYFNGELREGFYIRPIMKRCWAAELEVLEEISSICGRHDIKWYAFGGTLLGAVREHGFIPWDDDVDIMMLRDDYERFIHFAQSELTDGCYVANRRGSIDQAQPFVCVKNSTLDYNLDNAFLERFHRFPYVAGVDIFPVDMIPDDEGEMETYRILVGAAIDIGQNTTPSARLYECAPDIITEVEDLSDITGVNFDPDKPIAPQTYELADQLSAMYGDSGAKYCSIAAYYHSKPEFLFHVDAFMETLYLEFEDFRMPVPVGYDAVLRAFYGDDYMIPRRIAGYHDYPVFKRAEERLRDYYRDNDREFPDEYE